MLQQWRTLRRICSRLSFRAGLSLAHLGKSQRRVQRSGQVTYTKVARRCIEMSIAYRVDHEARVVVAVGQGILTEADFIEYQREVWSRPDVAVYSELGDLSRVTKIDMASHQIQNLARAAASMDERTSNSRLAIVAPGDLSFGLSRMFQAHRELTTQSTRGVGVFRTIEEALAFLGIDHVVPMPHLG